MLRNDKEETKDFRKERKNKNRKRRFNKNTAKALKIKRGIEKRIFLEKFRIQREAAKTTKRVKNELKSAIPE
jgi:hypothetical protein